MEKDEGKIEAISLKDLAKIDEEARNFQVDLIIIGGYAVRAYTKPRSWRFTKDMDFITTKKDLTALRGVFEFLGYDFERTEYGVKGSKRINDFSIELHISVDRVIDWSTGKEYILPDDIFKRVEKIDVKPSFEENKDLVVSVKVVPIEDVIVMKIMTERIKDQFDGIAMILNSFERVNLPRFTVVCKKSGLNRHIKKRLESILADIKKGLVKKQWTEFTGREFARKQEIVLKKRIEKLIEKL